MELTFKVDTTGADRKLKAGRKAVDRTVSKAGGDAIRAMKTASVKKVRERKSIKQGELSDKLEVRFPSGNEAKLWRLHVPSRAMPVSAYPFRPTKKGISVLINKSGRSLIPGAFYARMKSGHEGVFMRTGAAFRTPTQRYRGNARYAGQKRQAIKELYTTRIIDVFRDRGFIEEIVNRGKDVFTSTFKRVLPLEIAGLLK